jgi:hypothetical protein
VGLLDRITRPGRAALLVAVGAAGGAAAVAVANVDSGNTIHACVQLTRSGTVSVPDQTAPNVTVIDPGAGQKCIPPDGTIQNQTELTWNVTGPQGPPGANGTNGAPGKNGANGAPGNGNTYTITLPPITGKSSSFGSVTLSSNGSLLTFGILGVSTIGKGASGGGAAGKVSHQDLVVTKYIDKASPKLFQKVSNGTHIPKVTIQLEKTGKVYLKYTLTNVLISSIQSGGAGGSAPRENVTFTYGALKIQYTAQKK